MPKCILHLVFDTPHLKQTDMTTEMCVKIDITARFCLTARIGSEQSQMGNVTAPGDVGQLIPIL